MLDNFTFEGLHIARDLGCEYYADDPRPLSPGVKRAEYTIGGRDGTVIYPGGVWQTYKESGILVGCEGLEDEALDARMRRALAHLTSPRTGRGKIIFDSRPDVYRGCQIDASPTIGYGKWPRGAMLITLILQPIARSIQRERQSLAMSAREEDLVLLHHTQLPCPLEIELTHAGSEAMDTVTLSLPDGEGETALEDLLLAPGEVLRVSCEDGEAGAWITGTDGSVRSAIASVTRWADLRARQGDTLRIATGGGGTASVSVLARGCFL